MIYRQSLIKEMGWKNTDCDEVLVTFTVYDQRNKSYNVILGDATIEAESFVENPLATFNNTDRESMFRSGNQGLNSRNSL
jgi:hypothetical protein